MRRRLRDLWTRMVFVAEISCAAVFGIPLALVCALCLGVATYIVGIYFLAKHLGAIRRRYLQMIADAEAEAAAKVRKARELFG